MVDSIWHLVWGDFVLEVPEEQLGLIGPPHRGAICFAGEQSWRVEAVIGDALHVMPYTPAHAFGFGEACNG